MQSPLTPLQSWLTHHQNNTHTFFCVCGAVVDIEGSVDGFLCPVCGSDDYSDYDEKPQKIWKEFLTLDAVGEDADGFFVDFYAVVPNKEGRELQKRRYLQMILPKENRFAFDKTYLDNKSYSYAIYQGEGRVLQLAKLLEDKACKLLIEHLLRQKPSLEWVRRSELYKSSSFQKQLEILHFFFVTGFRELELFFWNREFFEFSLPNATTQKELLEFVANSTKKGVKKALFTNYLHTMESIKSYNPLVDYLFSRLITNDDHLKKLYALHPLLKKELIRAYNYEAAKEFVEFLLTHYSQKQIVAYFYELTSTSRLNLFLDTVSLLSANPQIYEKAQEAFERPKPKASSTPRYPRRIWK